MNLIGADFVPGMVMIDGVMDDIVATKLDNMGGEFDVIWVGCDGDDMVDSDCDIVDMLTIKMS